MIHAVFKSDPTVGILSLEVTGHAGAAEKGQDIVCASASILTYTVAQIIQFMYKQRQLKKRPRIKIESGDARIVVKPKDDAYGEVMHSFFVAQVGFSLLAHNYPDFVGLTMFGETETS